MTDLSLISTADLRSMESQLELGLSTLKGPALHDCEDLHSQVQEELEYRLTHIAIRGKKVRIKFDHMNGEVWAFEADSNYSECGCGSDHWAARNELEQLLEAM